MRDVIKQNVVRSRNTKRQHRRTRRHTAYIFLVILLVLGIGAALSVTLFFNVTDIIVENETDTPDERVVELSGIKAKENLIRLDTSIAEQRITAGIAYAENVSVTRKFPSTVVVKVEKAKPVANISQSYGYLLVSGSNRVLEELRDGPRAGLLIVTGYNPAQGTVGMMLQSEDEKRDNVLKTMTAAVSSVNDSSIISIDMKDQSDILVQFGENCEFHMGSSSDAVYKLRLAAKAIEKLKANKKYVLTMVGNNQISVQPADAVRTPAQTTVRRTETTTTSTASTTSSTSTTTTTTTTATTTATSFTTVTTRYPASTTLTTVTSTTT